MPPKRKSPITLKVKSLPAVSNCNGTFNFVTFVKNACERDTPYARLRRNPRTWTNAWFDHVLRTQEIFDVPHIQPTWRASSLEQIQKIPLSESALLVTGVDRPGVATSDGDESGVDVNTACAEEERSCPEWRLSDFSTLLAPTPFTARLLAFAALATRLGIRTFV